MRYLIYARKSSESEDKQAQSIEDQLADLRTLATQRGLDVAGELTEARSAKSPGGRPVFAQLVQRIQEGEADAILCWHVNRLFRNPIDFGTISWMLQTGDLKEILTPTQAHRTGDNVLLLSVENGMANQYILDLRKVVLRGLSGKVDKGWYPHFAPAGYLNKDGAIVKDPERFDQVRRLWDMALTGQFTVPQIFAHAQREGYTMRPTKRRGGGSISRSSLYAMFGNIFYAGQFVRGGQPFPGSHPPMITLQEFFAVKAHLKRQNQRQRTHTFAFQGLITCGHCGGAVCGEEKTKRLADGTVRTYRYYSCINSRKMCVRKVITEEQIAGQIQGVLNRLSLPAEFDTFSEAIIGDWREKAIASRELMKRENAEQITAAERKLDKLLDMHLRGLLDEAEYLTQKTRATNEVGAIRRAQQLLHEVTDASWESLENTVSLLHYGAEYFAGGGPAEQSMIARLLGASYVLTDRSLAVELASTFGAIAAVVDDQERRAYAEKNNLNDGLNGGETNLKMATVNLGGEPANGTENGSESKQKDPLGEDHRVWWNILDATRTALLASGAIIPNLVKTWAARQKDKS